VVATLQIATNLLPENHTQVLGQSLGMAWPSSLLMASPGWSLAVGQGSGIYLEPGSPGTQFSVAMTKYLKETTKGEEKIMVWHDSISYLKSWLLVRQRSGGS
jgi:hypothetical protein